MEDSKNRRKDYFVKKDFQRNFILKFCGLVILGSAISCAIIYFMSRGTVSTSFENSRLVIKSTADFILPAMLLSSIVSIILISIAAIGITLFTSHKIAGPLYRLEKDVRAIAAGKLDTSFQLRTGDELKDLVGSMNEMAASLRGSVAKLKDELMALEASADMGAAAKERVKKMKDALEKFTT